VGFVVDKVALGQVFSEYFGFPCLPIFIPPQSPSPIIWGWYNRPVVAAVPKVPPHRIKYIYIYRVPLLCPYCDVSGLNFKSGYVEGRFYVEQILL
jgi:hypothetical protein